MSDAEKTEIVINLSSTYWKLPPKARVYVDNSLIFDAEVTQPVKVSWSNVLSDGDHLITIELYGKDKYQTILDNNGAIVKDQLLNIDSVSFDDIDIGYLKHSLSEYYPNNQGVIKQCVNLGVNGRWELKFTTPIYIWLLENM